MTRTIWINERGAPDMSLDESTRDDALNAALAETAVAWERFIRLVDSVPLDRVDETGVCGDWSFKILIGHVAFWDGFEANRLAARGAFEEVDYQPLNDRNAVENVDRPFAELRAELDANHARAIAAIRQNPDVSVETVHELLDDHYDEHRQEIEAWLTSA
jgi:hypothetical protein